MAETWDFWTEHRNLSQPIKLDAGQSATILGEMFLAAVAREAFVPQIWTYGSSWGSLVTRIDISPGPKLFSEEGQPDYREYRPIQHPSLTPVQILAYSILRDGEGEATVAALLDEAMAVYGQKDEPVTEQWCKDHMREDADCYFLDEPGGGYCLTISLGCRRLSVYEYLSEEEIELIDDPKVTQVIALCRALNIPWRNS